MQLDEASVQFVPQMDREPSDRDRVTIITPSSSSRVVVVVVVRLRTLLLLRSRPSLRRGATAIAINNAAVILTILRRWGQGVNTLIIVDIVVLKVVAGLFCCPPFVSKMTQNDQRGTPTKLLLDLVGRWAFFAGRYVVVQCTMRWRRTTDDITINKSGGEEQCSFFRDVV